MPLPLPPLPPLLPLPPSPLGVVARGVELARVRLAAEQPGASEAGPLRVASSKGSDDVCRRTDSTRAAEEVAATAAGGTESCVKVACLRRFAEDDAEAASRPGRLAEGGKAVGAALAEAAL